MRFERFEGWGITGWVAVVLAVLLALTWASLGWNEEGVRSVTRWSAQIAVAFFVLAFGASSLRRVWRSPTSAWLLRNRRYLGVSFALAHFLHLGTLGTLGLAFPEPFVSELDALTILGGGGAYAFLAAMTATSFDRSAAWLGRKNWTRLHTAGGYWLWIVFAQSYIPRAYIVDGLYAIPGVALLAAFGLRMWVRFFARERVARAGSPVSAG